MNNTAALYAFAGWLTSRRERAIFSATDDASIAVYLVETFRRAYGWPEPEVGWTEEIRPVAADVPKVP